MADNNFLKPEQIAATALGLLLREIVLPRVVQRWSEAQFAGARDDTVSIRVPPILTARDYEWRTRTSPIQVDDIIEGKVDVTLDRHIYHAGAVTDEQLTLDIASFADQVLIAQTSAIGEALENIIAETLAGGDYEHTVEFGADPFEAAVAARRALNHENVPFAGRTLVLGADLEGAFLLSDKFNRVDTSGSDSALREAIIGRVAGFDVLTSNALEPNVGYALHTSAVVFGNAAPVTPEGANFGSSQNYQNLALRWLRDYDPNFLRDRSVCSSFAGCTMVTDVPMSERGEEEAEKKVVRAVKLTGGSNPGPTPPNGENNG